MTKEEFRKQAHLLVDWMADYLEEKENYPVTPAVKPKDIFQQIPPMAPEKAESFERIFDDFKTIILPGMTHWQHPSFFAYFPANNSEPSILAEMLMSTLGAQCMSWLTSPAATELEERVCEWLRDAKGIDATWKGVIHDTASTATLSAILTAREKATQFQINERGFTNEQTFRIYSSSHVHSSIDKAVKIAGIGVQNLVRIPVDEEFEMIPDELEKAILADKKAGFSPLCVVSALGTTSSTAVDPIDEITQIAQKHGLWHHIDAAFAGTALLLPEFQHLIKGHQGADSYVFNPHKWMFTNFDCTVFFVREPQYLVNTFSLTPEYLKTKLDDQVNNYRDWGIQLGRRFRALKLWFVIRTYGLEGIRQKLRHHLDLAQKAKNWIENEPGLEILAPVNFNTICFRMSDDHQSLDRQNQLNESWMNQVNATGKVFFSHTKLNGKFVIRWVIGQSDVEEKHILAAWSLLLEERKKLLAEQIT
ncbi:pyridoxal phosphate-dependent decarboxylase family protein [Algoriphagus hitonicola]|uniref:Aromatic-L-amino-acid decarboxylase n=1 Tax=Algoriphagus hitonicola TaxID=435880 RepID=A0A1I2SHI3_9BACT|nr:pyridoxal-dependent decarboxylase [Algoriphagus hitonicola]SFG52258.1 aromatic-L-amino-acid decarboxylase [Algoriphagus hitonicola]